jgi:hypothetical protein
VKARLLTKYGIYKELDMDHKAVYVICDALGNSVTFIDHYMFDVPEGYMVFEFKGVDIYGGDNETILIYHRINKDSEYEEELL